MMDGRCSGVEVRHSPEEILGHPYSSILVPDPTDLYDTTRSIIAKYQQNPFGTLSKDFYDTGSIIE